MLQKMDFDIGSLIYIIITLVAVVAGARGKKKKPGAKPAGGGIESGVESFFNKLGVQLDGLVDEVKNPGQDSFEEEILVDSEVPFAAEVSGYQNAYEASLNEEEESNDDYLFSSEEGVYDPNAIQNSELVSAEAVRTTEDSEIMDIIDLDRNDDHPGYAEVLRDFKLERAIIYSSIINRIEY